MFLLQDQGFSSVSFFLIEFSRVALVHKIKHVSSVQLGKTLSAHFPSHFL